MTITDLLMIFSVFAGPVVAVRLTRHLDEKKEIRERKLSVFKTLMATRATVLSPDHVEALNRIDLEFDERKPSERGVIEAWREYCDLLHNSRMDEKIWDDRRVELLAVLLQQMSKAIDYKYFDKTTIKNSAYNPGGYSEMDAEHALIRRGIIEILKGDRHVPFRLVPPFLAKPESESQIQEGDITSGS